MPVLLMVLTCGGCAAHMSRRQTVPGGLEGVVASELGNTPIAQAKVALCREQTQRGTIRDPFNPCDTELASTLTDRLGRFRLAWQADEQVGAKVAVTSTGYLPWASPLDVLPRDVKIALRRASTVEVTVVDAGGKPVQRAGAGWLVETRDGIQARYEVCCTSEQGKMSFGLDGVPEGSVTLFAVTGEPASRFGVAPLQTAAGNHYASVVKADSSLQTVVGRVVDAGGSPLTAQVVVEPAPNTTFSALDRVLLGRQSEDTDLRGAFGRYIATPARAILQLRVWTGLGGGADHVATEKVAQVETQFAEHPRPVELAAPAAPVVRCTMADPDGATVALSEIGIMFVPHDSPGHSGSCVFAGGPLRANDDERSRASKEVRLIWPRQAKTLMILGRGLAVAQGQSYVGEIKLDQASDTCRILGRQ